MMTDGRVLTMWGSVARRPAKENKRKQTRKPNQETNWSNNCSVFLRLPRRDGRTTRTTRTHSMKIKNNKLH